MQFTVVINQLKALEWGLNLQQAALFAFLYEHSSSSSSLQIEERQFWPVSNSDICSSLPVLTDRPDTIYRLMKQLEAKGLIEIRRIARTIRYARISDKGAKWSEPCRSST